MTTNSKTITLSQFLKFIGIADTGGQAKMMIQSGEVLVNGVVDTRRGRQLVTGDRVTVGSQTFEVDVN
jgi:ribosome-associated protein